jgi:hypothetical protein
VAAGIAQRLILVIINCTGSFGRPSTCSEFVDIELDYLQRYVIMGINLMLY